MNEEDTIDEPQPTKLPSPLQHLLPTMNLSSTAQPVRIHLLSDDGDNDSLNEESERSFVGDQQHLSNNVVNDFGEENSAELRPSNARVMVGGCGGSNGGKPNPRLSDTNVPKRTNTLNNIVLEEAITFGREKEDDKEDNNSYQSVKQVFRNLGQRRSTVMQDTPGYFQRAKDIGSSENVEIPLLLPLIDNQENPVTSSHPPFENNNNLGGSDIASFKELDDNDTHLPPIRLAEVAAGGTNDNETIMSSQLFEKCDTQRNNQSSSQGGATDFRKGSSENQIKITNLKDLLRLFRVNLNDNNTFEYNSQSYLIDFMADEPTPSHYNPLYKMSAYFATGAGEGYPQPQFNSINRIPSELRHTFGMLGGQNQNQNHTSLQQHQYVPSQFKAHTIDPTLATAGIKNLTALDHMLLSREHSPSSVSQKFQSSIIYQPDFNATFSREQSLTRAAQMADKEIQVEIISSTTTPNSGRYQESMQKSNSYLTSYNPPSLLVQKSANVAIVGNGGANSNNLNQGQDGVSTGTEQEYYAQIQENLQKQLADEMGELDEEAFLEQLLSGKTKKPKKQPAKNQSQNAVPSSQQNPLTSSTSVQLSLTQQPSHLLPSQQPMYPSGNHTPLHKGDNQSKSGTYVDLMLKNSALSVSPPPSSLTPNSSSNNQPKLRRIVSLGGGQAPLKSDMQAMLSQIQSENERLREDYERLMSHKYIGGASRNLSDADLHMVFLFATPLVIRKGGGNGKSDNFKDQYKVQPLLEFKKEFKEIKRSLKETKRKIKIRAMQATIDNLTMILAQNPLALHFTGHGTEFKVGKEVTNSLLLEYEDGEAEQVSEQQLFEIIQSSKADIEFVFVASCYSEFAGKVFLKAGARHVICVKQGNEIADEAVINFSKTFYHAVFKQNMTICESFKMAKHMVEVRYGPGESSKFNILTKKDHLLTQNTISPVIQSKPKAKKRLWMNMPQIDDDDEEFTNVQLPEPTHTCKIFGPFSPGGLETQETPPKFLEIPSPVDNLVGRQIEIFEVVHNVLKNRLVTIIGLPGIGKTALAKNAVNYIADRKLFKLGIIYFSLKGYKNIDVFMKKLVTNIVMSNFELDSKEREELIQSNIEEHFRRIVDYFKQEEDQLLVVFDNAEELLYHDRVGFREMVTVLLSQCHCLKFLITSRVTIGVLQDIQEKIIVLQELSPGYSVDLFFSRAREVDDQEKRELLAFKPEGDLVLVGGDGNNTTTAVTSLVRHHLFKILAGNPHAIILAAPLLINKRLKELYELLNSEKLLEVLKVDGVTDSTVASLCLSLEASIIVLQKEDPVTLQFFYLIGLLPGGIFKEELVHIWKEGPSQFMTVTTGGNAHESHVDKLMRLSLLQLKEQAGDKTQQKLMLPPFINSYAEQTIEPQLKERFQATLCAYYVKILKKMYRIDFKEWCRGRATKDDTSNNKEDQSPAEATPRRLQLEQEFVQEQRKKLIRHETNIWASIYRLSKCDLPVQLDELDFDSIARNDSKQRVRRYSHLVPRDKLRNHLRIQENRQRKSSMEEFLQDEGDGQQEDFAAQLDAQLLDIPEQQEVRHLSEGNQPRPQMHLLRQRFKPAQVIEEESQYYNDDNKSDFSSGALHHHHPPSQSPPTTLLQPPPPPTDQPPLTTSTPPLVEADDFINEFYHHNQGIVDDYEPEEVERRSDEDSIEANEQYDYNVEYEDDGGGIERSPLLMKKKSYQQMVAGSGGNKREVLIGGKGGKSPKVGGGGGSIINKLFQPMKKHFIDKISQEVSQIMRHSIVKFSRPSSLRHTITLQDEEIEPLSTKNDNSNTFKSDQSFNKLSQQVTDVVIPPIESLKTEKVMPLMKPLLQQDNKDAFTLNEEDMPMRSFSHADMFLHSMMLGPSQSAPDHGSHRAGGGTTVLLSDPEKLVIYYAVNLYLLRDDESALKLIKRYALKEVKGGSALYEANIWKILGLIHLRRVEINEAMQAFKQAEKLFNKCNALLGQALTKFAIGFMYRSNFSELLTQNERSDPSTSAVPQHLHSTNNQISLAYLNDSLLLFNQLNHIVGLARCHEHLSLIYKQMSTSSITYEQKYSEHYKEGCKLSSQFNRYQQKYRNSCHHVQRTYGKDISLMVELVTDNLTKDLFPVVNSKTSGLLQVSGMQNIQKREHSARVISKFNEEDSAQMLRSQELNLSHQVSAPPIEFLQYSDARISSPHSNNLNHSSSSPLDQITFQNNNNNTIYNPISVNSIDPIQLFAGLMPSSSTLQEMPTVQFANDILSPPCTPLSSSAPPKLLGMTSSSTKRQLEVVDEHDNEEETYYLISHNEFNHISQDSSNNKQQQINNFKKRPAGGSISPLTITKHALGNLKSKMVHKLSSSRSPLMSRSVDFTRGIMKSSGSEEKKQHHVISGDGGNNWQEETMGSGEGRNDGLINNNEENEKMTTANKSPLNFVEQSLGFVGKALIKQIKSLSNSRKNSVDE